MTFQQAVIDGDGLEIRPTEPASMGISVAPGRLLLADGTTVESRAERRFEIRLAGQRHFQRQRYHIHGEGEVSPCGWNGEDIRGSGGSPYQRMVPGSLRVLNAERTFEYQPDKDYVYDYYWGSIKRHPQGAIADGELLSLDYTVWLCRYDAVVITAEGEVRIIEGDEEAPESRELLLPEPPSCGQDAFVLAHIFIGWGNTRIMDGESSITALSPKDASPLPRLLGRYEDMVPREYLVEIVDVLSKDRLVLRVGATGEDYGTGENHTRETLRWTAPLVVEKGARVPLWLETAYNRRADWGLALDFSTLTDPAQARGQHFVVAAVPHMIFDLRHEKRDPALCIPIEQKDVLAPLKTRLAAGETLRVAFYGESTTRAGHWPYQLLDGLRTKYPRARLFSSLVAVGGEGCVPGIHRLADEVLPLRPDLVILEYFINDTATENPVLVEHTMRTIITKLQNAGARIVLLSHNGGNPVFSTSLNSRDFLACHELYRRLARELGCTFVGAYDYFRQLHRCGKYFLTELKGNMVNHPYGNVDPAWGPFDQVVSAAILSAFEA